MGAFLLFAEDGQIAESGRSRSESSMLTRPVATICPSASRVTQLGEHQEWENQLLFLVHVLVLAIVVVEVRSLQWSIACGPYV